VSSGPEAETSVGPVHPATTPSHPTLSDNQILAAHKLAELPIGLTWQEKAQKIGIDTGTLFSYRQVPEFMELVIQVSRENLRADIPGAYDALRQGLKARGTAGARYLELFFKLTGELSDQEQAQGLRSWLDLVADCSSDLLVVAIQRTTGVAQRPLQDRVGRVVASGENVSQGGSMELTETPAPGGSRLRGELEL